MKLTPEELIHRLPRRDFWFVVELCKAFEVTKRAIQALAKKHNLGTLVRQGPRGTYVFTERDLEELCNHVGRYNDDPLMKAKILEDRLKKTEEQIQNVNDSLFRKE